MASELARDELGPYGERASAGVTVRPAVGGGTPCGRSEVLEGLELSLFRGEFVVPLEVKGYGRPDFGGGLAEARGRVGGAVEARGVSQAELAEDRTTERVA